MNVALTAPDTTTDQMPSGWVRCRVDETGLVQLGRQRSPGKRSDKYPTKYVRAANITWNGLKLDDVLDMEFTPKERETFALKDGDILLSEASGSADEVGKPAIWRGEIALCCFQNTVIRYRPEATEPRYANHLFSHFAQSGVFTKASLGVGIHHLGAQRFSALTLPLPPLAEQARIADRIDELVTELAAGVNALERVKRKLKRYRSAVLHSAVTGRLTASWRAANGPPEEPGAKLLERILVERRRQWEKRTLAKYVKNCRTPPKNWRDGYVEPAQPKKSGMPELPSGWCWATLDQVFSVVRNGTAIVPRAESGVPILRISAVRPMSVDLKDVRYLTADEADRAESWVEIGDLLFTRYNGSARLCGVCGRVDTIVSRTAHPDKLIKCQVTAGTIESAFVEIASNTSYTRLAIEARLRTTAGQVGVSGSDIKSTPLPMPPRVEQIQIIEDVQSKLSQIDAMDAEVERGLARAARLRQAILKAAFAGKLVPQDPNDEPASALLDRIRSLRAQSAAASNGNNGKRHTIASKQKRCVTNANANGRQERLFDAVPERERPKRAPRTTRQ